MATGLIEHSFEIPPLEDLVRDERGSPVFTIGSHGLQATNQKTLWELYLRTERKTSGLKIPKGAIIDAGVGDGLFLALAPYMIFDLRKDMGRRTIIGVDLDKNKVRKARRIGDLVAKAYAERTRNAKRPEGHTLKFVIQDPQDLAKMDPMYMTVDGFTESLPKIALIWSNSMFHWIKEPKDKYAALTRFHVALAEGGVLCMSMSTGGTAKDFLAAYNNVMMGLGPYSLYKNLNGFRRAELEPDPIGSRPLGEIVNMVEESGFEVKEAMALREPAEYKDPREYAQAVKVYGMETFLRPVSHTPNKFQERIWGAIVEEFLRILGKGGWEEGMPYNYSQFNIYLVAKKRPIPEELASRGEYKLLKLMLGERGASLMNTGIHTSAQE